jgi:hypothetical protein
MFGVDSTQRKGKRRWRREKQARGNRIYQNICTISDSMARARTLFHSRTHSDPAASPHGFRFLSSGIASCPFAIFLRLHSRAGLPGWLLLLRRAAPLRGGCLPLAHLPRFITHRPTSRISPAL